jgi:hypothetical protein
VADTEKNAVEMRLEYLGGLWMAFAAKPAARLLRWVADADAREIIDVFMELHQTHPAGIPDVFVLFEVPFRDEISYGADLHRAWRSWFEGIKNDLIEVSRDPTWRMPTPNSGEPGYASAARVMASFQQFYKGEQRNLAVALVPSEIADPAGWCRWLQGLVKSELHADVRVLVIDDAKAPALAPLVAAEPIRIVSQTPKIDIGGVYSELLAEGGGSGPGVVFRKHFVGMLTAAKNSDFAAAQKCGKSALAVAGAEKWADLQVAAQMGLASILAANGKSTEAMAGYRTAVTFADAVPPENPAGAILAVQTRMGVAGALFANKKYPEAAARYADAAPRAAAAGDYMLAMENWRMAAACHELSGDAEKSWECGEKSLDCGAKIDPEIRGKTTLAFAGHGLLRLAGKRAFSHNKDALINRMNNLVGPGWEKRRT